MQTRRRLAAMTVGITVGLGAAGASIAQEDSGTLQEIVVTGSRIARPNLESAVPVATVSGAEFYETGNTSIGDTLNDLPQIRSTFSQSNSSRFLGTAGLNLLDLRGLGTQRTLVLVNGRRHVGSDILANAVSPDTNTFPTDLIERVDVVTGGNSAVYGSDAIAGVVNFVLKNNFDGMQFRAQGGQAFQGDGENYVASALFGKNFLDDRGNVAVSLEYANQDSFFASDRPNLRQVDNFVQVDADDPDAVNGSDGVPDRLFFKDIRGARFSNGGGILLTNPNRPDLTPCGSDGAGSQFGCSLVFQSDGTLVPQTGTRIGLGPVGSFIGGNGSTGREGKLLAIQPEFDRVNLNVIGHLDINDALRPYVEAKFVRTEGLSFVAPAFFSGSTIDGVRERPRFDNPFLSEQARATINQTRVSLGLAPITNGATRLAVNKNLLDLGPRQEEATRETFRIVLGTKGDFASNWNYDVSFNYGKFEEDTDVLGNLDTQRFLLAMDSARDASGNIVCRSQIDPAARIPAFDGDLTNARLANDVASCVPLNPFGQGNISPQARNYLLQNTTSEAEIEQSIVSATVAGDTSSFLTLPAGAIGLAFGLEHREEKNSFRQDALVNSGITFYNAIPNFDPPTFKVDEVFSEVRVPILKDLTGAQDLSLSAAGRYADYDGPTGGVFAYNYGLEYAPIQGLRFRTNFARSVRAPNLVDSAFPLSQNFATVGDPCSRDNIATGSATRAANCAAAGIPADYNFRYSQSLELLSGGNPALKEEESDSMTIGFVFQPTFLPGFSLSVDYFDIEIDDVITAPGAQDILNACYDSATLDNQFCPLFQRNMLGDASDGTGNGPSGEVQFQVLEGNLQQITLNYASSRSRGVDVDASYPITIPRVGKLNTRLVYTRTLQRDDFLDPSNPDAADQILGELGDPRTAFNLNLDLTMGKWTVGYQLRYLGDMLISAAEAVIGVDGQPAQDADFALSRNYPSITYSDVRVAYDFNRMWNFYAGVDNLGNKLPPFGLTGAGGGSGIYEARGRFLFGGARVKF